MIIWNGLIAKAFEYYKENDNILVFASWVSNSQNKDLNEFEREINLLKDNLENNKNKLFIYISSCSIEDETLKDSLYVKHKINAENIIKNNSNSYLIIRTSNPVWFTKNKNTFLNFLFNKIKNWENFKIWKNANRNLIDVEDLFKISKDIIDNKILINKTINIANKLNFPILKIVKIFEEHLNLKANYDMEDSWWTPTIELKEIENIIKKLWIIFWEDYIENIIKKYY